jgi:hypothetical protein
MLHVAATWEGKTATFETNRMIRCLAFIRVSSCSTDWEILGKGIHYLLDSLTKSLSRFVVKPLEGGIKTTKPNASQELD